jgi:ribonuclease R
LLHRAIKYQLAKLDGNEARLAQNGGWHYSVEEMLQLGEHCSMTERRADEATRDVADWLKCDFMLDQVGQVFHGVISSVTALVFLCAWMNCLSMAWCMSHRWITTITVLIR